MKRRTLLIVTMAFLMPLTQTCKKYYSSDEQDGTTTDGSEASDDYSWDSSGVIRIVLNGTSVTENSDSVTVEGTKVTIISSGTYSITGSLTDGQLIVDSDDGNMVRLILDGVNITCSAGAPVFVKKAAKAMIVLEAGTENFLTDGESYVLDDEGEPNATVFSKAYLSFFGTGSLTVNGNYNDGIAGKDGLVIREGSINVVAVDDGIRGKDYLKIHDGTITVASGGDGLKSDNETDTDRGYIEVDAGTINVTSAGDALSAINSIKINDGSFNIVSGAAVVTKEGPNPPGGGGSSGGYTGTVSAKGFKTASDLVFEKGRFIINSADDGLHANNSVTINGGVFSIRSGDDGIHADKSIVINGDSLQVLTSYEAVESAGIAVNGGFVSLVSSDDGFNATMGSATEANDGSLLKITGGNIVVNSSGGDAIDSNGNVVMTGGTVIAHGPQSQPEVGIDVNGTFNISGGLLIATGPNSGNMIEATSTSSEQNALKITMSSTLSASSLFHIQDAEGNELVTYKPVRTIYYVVFSSPSLVSSSSYAIYTGGTSTGTNNNGIFTGGTYSGGSLKKEFTITGRVTSVSF